MCGILAIIDRNGKSIPDDIRRKVPAALKTIAHRGPDDEGIEDYGSVILAQRRLSIIDLSSAGHQPMKSADGNAAVTFNGQIYNWKPLRAQLEKLGHRHITQCDTEILLTAYAQYGADMAAHLTGMWAFVLYDQAQKRVVISRDRLGIKPLYRYTLGDITVYASEIKAILSLFPQTARLNETVLKRYITRGWTDDIAQTFYQNIELVPAGSMTVLANGQWNTKTFWSHPVPSRDKNDLDEWRDLFIKTVEDHIQSDAPLATTLSGGLDSNAINGVIARVLGRGKDLNTFSVIAPDTANENALIDASVKDLGINHHYIDIGDIDIVAAIDEMLSAHDEPTITAGQVNQFIFRRAVADQGYKVLLVGEGADEILSGYAKIIPSFLADLGNASDEMMRNFTELSGLSTADMFAQAEKLKATGIGRRAIQTTLFGYDLINPAQDTSETALQFEKSYANIKPGIPGFYTYRELMDRLTIDIPQVLRNEDRNSMAHGIESRPVFLDHRLFELSWKYPFERLMEHGTNKAIMRQALKNEIPAAVLNNRKKFRRPGSITDLVYNRLQSPLRALLKGPAFADKNFWNSDMASLFERDLAALNFDHAFIWLRVYMFGRIAALRFGV